MFDNAVEVEANTQQLTPFVTKEKEATKDPPKKMTAREYLELWYDRNPQEYHDLEQASGS